jgi:hypothetical protein
VLVRNGEETDAVVPGEDTRALTADIRVGTLAKDEYLYLRAETAGGEMAWASPLWGG